MTWSAVYRKGPSRERYATPMRGGSVPRLRKPRTSRFRDVARFMPVFNTKSVLIVPVQVQVQPEHWRLLYNQNIGKLLYNKNIGKLLYNKNIRKYDVTKTLENTM